MKTIQLTRGLVALVDDEDFEELNKYSWRAVPNGLTYYAARTSLIHESYIRKNRTTILMHHQILGKPPFGLMTDHEDGKGFNNQKYNLSFVTPRENCQNMKNINKSSKYPGVCWDKRGRKWVAYIGSRETKKHLGRFTNEKEAYQVYQRAVQKIEAEESSLPSLTLKELIEVIHKVKEGELNVSTL